jgi:hypothetical protein
MASFPYFRRISFASFSPVSLYLNGIKLLYVSSTSVYGTKQSPLKIYLPPATCTSKYSASSVRAFRILVCLLLSRSDELKSIEFVCIHNANGILLSLASVLKKSLILQFLISK